VVNSRKCVKLLVNSRDAFAAAVPTDE
jgi:hypothetical protein